MQLPHTKSLSSEHLSDEFVDVLTAVAVITSLSEVVALGVQLSWVEFEGPEEVVGFFEGLADGVDLVDQVFHALDGVFVEGLVDDGVVDDWDALSFDLGVATSVEDLADGFEGWLTICDVWLNDLEGVQSGLVDADKDCVVDLSEAEQVEDGSDLWRSGLETSQTNDEEELGLGWDDESALLGGFSDGFVVGSFNRGVFLVVLFNSLECVLDELFITISLLLQQLGSFRGTGDLGFSGFNVAFWDNHDTRKGVESHGA